MCKIWLKVTKISGSSGAVMLQHRVRISDSTFLLRIFDMTPVSMAITQNKTSPHATIISVHRRILYFLLLSLITDVIIEVLIEKFLKNIDVLTGTNNHMLHH